MAEPLAYFITASAYGNRLHGDERGTVDRDHNTVGTPFRQPEPGLAAWSANAWSVIQSISTPLAEPALKVRSWLPVCIVDGRYAVHCRTNHTHVVLTSDASIERTAHSLKSYATRALRQAGLVGPRQPVWARSASMKTLTSDHAVASAVNYTLNAQGATSAARTRSARATSGRTIRAPRRGSHARVCGGLIGSAAAIQADAWRLV
ncbi:hypothetical protein [Candidatus Amarobacter glycogenicus]|uniref:hypothetical protein n=1 Tax=Candidatus Amarobacter glycogenicus TaxID=3140699 RepID=UPI00313707B6|nr:hypothetical protein [Dehalococcoidia bacterium]